MKFYAALLVVLMVGIAVGQKKSEQETGTPYLFTIATNPGPKCEDIADKKLQLACYVRLVCEVYPQLNGCALDVPAIQVATRLGCDTTGETRARGCMDHPVPVYSCKDKARILEHDESTPPKFWCRKVQQ